MSDIPTAIELLGKLSCELDTLSDQLAEVERRLVPVEAEYEDYRSSFEEGLWQQHVSEGAKLPSEDLRKRMAHRAMGPELLGRYTSLVSQRRRMRERIGSLKATVDAQRSILSALKAQLDASSELAKGAA